MQMLMAIALAKMILAALIKLSDLDALANQGVTTGLVPRGTEDAGNTQPQPPAPDTDPPAISDQAKSSFV
jgi:hypothetical protein